MDIDKLYSDIRSALWTDPSTSSRLDNLTARWHVNPEELLLLDNRIYVPNVNDLQLRVLQYMHDHPISRHFRQTRTLELV